MKFEIWLLWAATAAYLYIKDAHAAVTSLTGAIVLIGIDSRLNKK